MTSTDTHKKYKLKWNSHCSHLNGSVASLLRSERFTDVVLCTLDGSQIPAHMFILSSCSVYLSSLFEGQRSVTRMGVMLYIVLPSEVSTRALKILIEYMYKGETTVSKEVLDTVLKAGEVLKIRGLWRKTDDNSGYACITAYKTVTQTISTTNVNKQTIAKKPEEIQIQPKIAIKKDDKLLTAEKTATQTISTTNVNKQTIAKKLEEIQIQPKIAIKKDDKLLTAEKTATQTISTTNVNKQTIAKKPEEIQIQPKIAIKKDDKLLKAFNPVQPGTTRPVFIGPPKLVFIKTTKGGTQAALRPGTPKGQTILVAPAPSAEASVPAVATPAPATSTVTVSTTTVSEDSSDEPLAPRILRRHAERKYGKRQKTETKSDNEETIESEEGHDNVSEASRKSTQGSMESEVQIKDEPEWDASSIEEEEDSLIYSPLACELCAEVFTVPAAWVRHVQGHARSDQQHPRKRKLRSASDDTEETMALLRCDLCQKHFPNPAEWVRHIQSTHTESENSTGIVMPVEKPKGKSEYTALALKDYLVEYSKSSRATCRHCKIKICKDEVRISKTVYDTEVMGSKFGGLPLWHHVKCFAERRSEFFFFAGGETIPGFKSLKKEDQAIVKNEIKPIKKDEVPVKKLKEEPKNEAKLKEENEKKLEKQNKPFYKYRNALSELAKRDLEEILEHNSQEVPAGKNDPATRVPQDVLDGKSIPKSGSMDVKSSKSAVKLKIQGGTAVAPAYKLEDVVHVYIDHDGTKYTVSQLLLQDASVGER